MRRGSGRELGGIDLDKFYVVGVTSRGRGHPRSTYGTALVYAPDKRVALSMVRDKTGLVPNPGGIWLLGTETQRRWDDTIPEDIDEATKMEAMSQGVVLLWQSDKL